jgi:hypothetical protein
MHLRSNISGKVVGVHAKRKGSLVYPNHLVGVGRLHGKIRLDNVLEVVCRCSRGKSWSQTSCSCDWGKGLYSSQTRGQQQQTASQDLHGRSFFCSGDADDWCRGMFADCGRLQFSLPSCSIQVSLTEVYSWLAPLHTRQGRPSRCLTVDERR